MEKEQANLNFIDMEHDVLNFWNENRCFEKLVQKNKNGKRYRFLDGPMTANNSMGIHHAWGRTLKDCFIKYHAMKGESCQYQNGFDAQGLWVEVEVEKELGFKNKKDIESYGLDNFTNACMARVKRCGGLITEQSKRLGQWMDWDNSYYTNSDENITSIWHFLKVCNQKGLLEKKYRVMNWCPRCGTSLSEHEMTDSYHDVECKAVFCKLPVVSENTKMLVWTTTPWTLTSNVALAVNENLTYCYCKVKSDDALLVLCKDALKNLGDDLVEVVREVKGAELVGKTYETMFPYLKPQQFEHKIVAWEEVDATEGVGVVHIAPGCGESDFELGERLGLPKINPIDESGVITSDFGEFAGKDTNEVRDFVFEKLAEQNKLYKTHNYKHRYAFCWRCKTDIVYKLVSGWYIKSEPIRKDLIEAAKNVEWKPDYAGKRMLDWLNNMGDWNISRSRFYGLPLPFYVCPKCGKLQVVGSKEELIELATDKEKAKNIPNLHRPWIDDIKIKCECGAEVSRIPEVGDCWLDAGITPFSTKKYFTDKEYFKNNFPSECVIEMVEQIRLWFYSLLFMSVVLEGKAPYEKVMTYESVIREDGGRFHKSGYMIKFDEAAEKMGADAIRYLYASAPISNNVRFGYGLGDEVKRKLLGFWNAYIFYNTYASIDNPKLDGYKPNFESMNITDRWLLERTAHFAGVATKNYDNFELADTIKEFESYVDDLTNWYIRINRRRFWKNDGVDQLNAYYVLYNAIKTTCQIMAPIIPFITEHIWQKLVRETQPNEAESIHLSSFPTSVGYGAENLLDETNKVREIIYLAQKLRAEHQIKVKQPLSKMILKVTQDYAIAVEDFKQIILDELNIKEVEFATREDEFNDHSLVLNFRKAGAVLKGAVNGLKQKLIDSSKEEMNEYVKAVQSGSDVNIEGFGKLSADLFEVKLMPKKEFAVANLGNNLVVLDIELTDSLIKEGKLRELIRELQVARKEADFNIDDRISLNIETSDAGLNEIISQNIDLINAEVLCVSNSKIEKGFEKTIEIDGKNLNVKMKRI
jgi:isoleucyl-tRNA synthetase